MRSARSTRIRWMQPMPMALPTVSAVPATGAIPTSVRSTSFSHRFRPPLTRVPSAPTCVMPCSARPTSSAAISISAWSVPMAAFRSSPNRSMTTTTAARMSAACSFREARRRIPGTSSSRSSKKRPTCFPLPAATVSTVPPSMLPMPWKPVSPSLRHPLPSIGTTLRSPANIRLSRTG